MTEKQTISFLKILQKTGLHDSDKAITNDDLATFHRDGYIKITEKYYTWQTYERPPSDMFCITDAGIDLIDAYEERIRPILIAEESNKKAKIANLISLAAILISLTSILITLMK